MKTVKVYEVGADTGFCKVLYRTVPKKQLICTLEETNGVFTWFTCTDDNCWNEPIGEIDMDKWNIEIIPGKEARKLIKEAA